MDEFVQQMGFTDAAEFNRLVASVDLTTPEKIAAFKEWQYEDGTKDGLLKLLDTQHEAES